MAIVKQGIPNTVAKEPAHATMDIDLVMTVHH
jgi:hypothetical protein